VRLTPPSREQTPRSRVTGSAGCHLPLGTRSSYRRRMTSSALTNRVFLAATAAVALHVADDNFIQPAGGTTAADHLVSGLVPLVLLGVAAWFHSRVRAGAAGAIALSVGLFGVVVGAIEAGYYTQAVGPSGDDYSGFLAAAAGLEKWKG